MTPAEKAEFEVAEYRGSHALAFLASCMSDEVDAADWWQGIEYYAEGEWLAPYSEFELAGNAAFGRPVRRKPRMRHLIDANGERWEFPEPMREEPEDGFRCWLVFNGQFPWDSAKNHKKLLNHGRLHATREARDAHERALIAASGGAA
tara:strand:+ start:2607 stop:3050 length:444 start_codon:yes stop_codon:yes gene_type:complete